MGTWECKTFVNDSALDWVIEFQQAENKLKFLEKSLLRQYREGAFAEETLAAAETIAAMHGHPPSDFPEELNSWVARKRKPLEPKLLTLALQSVEWVQCDSELSALWKDTAENDDWHKEVEDLKQRLRKEPVTPLKLTQVKRPTSAALLSLYKAESSDSWDFRRDGFPDLSPTAKGLEKIEKVEIDLGCDFSKQELEQIAQWLAASPSTGVSLIDLERGRGFKLRLETLNLFSRTEELMLYLETLKSLDFLRDFKNLRRLFLIKVHKTCEIENVSIVFPIRQLDLSSLLKFSSLNFLRSCPELERLEIGCLELVSDVGALFELKNLQTLICSNFRESLVSLPLERLINLQRLSCAPTCRADLKQYTRIPNLKQISFALYQDFQPSDMDCFIGHASLRAVGVEGFGWKSAQNKIAKRLGLKVCDARAW